MNDDLDILNRVRTICDKLADTRRAQSDRQWRVAAEWLAEAQMLADDLRRELAVRESALFIHGK